MIDVIIPAYNAHKTIQKTLISICLQDIKDKLNIYIIDDCSNKNYDDEIDLFKTKLNIKQLKTDKNRGPGYARQYGIDNSNGEYIIFIDADDLFYDNFSIKNLYEIIKLEHADLVCGTMYQEIDNDLVYSNNHQGCLHGKLYRREFLKKYNIRFNNTYSSEDNSFNQLVLIANPNMYFSDSDIYIYKNNDKSLTNSSEDYFISSIKWDSYNYNWVIKEAELRNFDKHKIALVAIDAMSLIFYKYCIWDELYHNINEYDIFNWCRESYENYLKYEDEYNELEKYTILFSRFDEEKPLINFTDFLKKFKNN